MRERQAAATTRRTGSCQPDPNYDFLPGPAVVLANVEVPEHGKALCLPLFLLLPTTLPPTAVHPTPTSIIFTPPSCLPPAPWHSFCNVMPGNVQVDLSTLLPKGGDACITLLAMDASSAAQRTLPVAVDGPAPPFRTIVHQTPLDANRHFTQNTTVTALQAGETAQVTAASDTVVAEFGSFSLVYKLYAALSNNR